MFDSGPGSLRDTIAAAASRDTIKFDSSIFGQTIKLTSGGLTIAQNLDIEGPVGNSVKISGLGFNTSPEFVVFDIHSGFTVTLSGLTITNGFTLGQGGGILNNGTLTVSHCTLSDNFALGGGGIWNNGTLTVIQSTLSGNTAHNDGGGIFNIATLTISDSTLSNNTTQDGFSGGGIANLGGTATVSHCTLSQNTADGNGGGIDSEGATLTVSDSTLSGNRATGDFGQGGNGGGIYNNFGATLTINRSTLSQNTAVSGGGIYNASTLNVLDNSTIKGNTPDDVKNFGGTVDVESSTIGKLD
jgi:predicted outer membrane repeat protein